MIEVVYRRSKHSLSVKGHAHSGEPGHDIVCAAASILVYTLAAAVINADTAKQLAKDPMAKIEEGDSLIACRPINRMKAVITLIFDAICAGFEILSQKYQDNISYEVRV